MILHKVCLNQFSGGSFGGSSLSSVERSTIKNIKFSSYLSRWTSSNDILVLAHNKILFSLINYCALNKIILKLISKKIIFNIK
jgi:hypothetical protein